MPQTVSDRLADSLEHESRPLVAFLTMLTRSRQVADDLFQETCLEAWRRRDKLPQDAELGPWLRAIARYQALRHFRRVKRSKLRPLSPAVLDHLESSWSEIESALEPDRRRAALATCLSGLEPTERTALSARYAEGHSFAEIGRQAERTESAAKMWLSRLRRKLHECIQRRLRSEGSR
ncbi:MAG: sigma-70 family RNA polymerase sigma factor [Planctomycetota bacterium]